MHSVAKNIACNKFLARNTFGINEYFFIAQEALKYPVYR